MKRRTLLFGIALAVTGLAIPAGLARPAKEATVTLEITGMT